ncbi:globin-like-protein [Corynascus novoguineensis]|uniref:Globin-like-protein n=1 Tax=Corynascus novoguineensis TaxID=1126955 RepID=A0AAN7HF78_9PEZI|nr:globin-like-protein [Corynascus novoguineensis]
MSTARSRPMQHVDRKSLYTDLEVRIRYLHSFLDFGASDIEALRSGSKYIQALIPAVVNIVYRKLLQYDITARAFQTRSTAFEGPMDADPDETSPQILHRKLFLRAYLKKLCSDPTQMEFWEYLDKVGMMHTGLGRARPLHVEYIHIGAALAVIQDVLSEAILSHPRLTLARKIAIARAVGKVIWIQNDLFARWYVTDGDEFTAGVDYTAAFLDEGNKEGFLRGKKVLDPEEEEENQESEKEKQNAKQQNGEASEEASKESERISCPAQQREGDRGQKGMKAGVCPFTGIMVGMQGLELGEDEGRGKAGIDGTVSKEVEVVNGE